jgi:hypothetical protein
MPNSFNQIDVPLADGPGVPLIASALGRQKTIAFSGSKVRGRYVVEGSNDGGNTWDILIDDDGAQALFTSAAPGLRIFDCILDRIRVRSINNGQVATPPTISVGASPLLSTPIFGVLDMPVAPGSGQPFDLGLSAGPFKTFILRGAIPTGARYTILGSIDGQRFDEALLFTSDQQGTRSLEFLCRFLRVDRGAIGPTPVVAFGSEGVVDAGAGATLSIPEAGKVSTTTATDEEVLRQYRVPLAALQAPRLVVTLSGDASPPTESQKVAFNVRVGGTPGLPDGTVLVTVTNDGTTGGVVSGTSAPFPRPIETSSLIKVTAQGDGILPASLAHFSVLFQST